MYKNGELMEQEMSKQQTIDYQSYVVKRNLEDYWRAEEKVQLILNGMTGKIPVTTLCKLNNVTPSLYYEWREKFLASVGAGPVANMCSPTGRTKCDTPLSPLKPPDTKARSALPAFCNYFLNCLFIPVTFILNLSMSTLTP